jgi:hypothetical protein
LITTSSIIFKYIAQQNINIKLKIRTILDDISICYKLI